MVRDHEVACSSHVASTRTGIRAHLAPFLRVRTAVIYPLVNSLVLTLKSSRSATLLPVLAAWQKRYSYIAMLKRAHLAPFLRAITAVIYLLVNFLVLALKSSRSATLLRVWRLGGVTTALWQYCKLIMGAFRALCAFNVALSLTAKSLCCAYFLLTQRPIQTQIRSSFRL